MSSSTSVQITKTGTVLKPVFNYKSAGTDYPMGHPSMYVKFNVNFSDPNVANETFSKPPGVEMMKTILNNEKCPLYFDIKDSPEFLGLSPEELDRLQADYLRSIANAFDKIRLFISTLSNTGRNAELYTQYSSILQKISSKISSKLVKGTPVEIHLTNMKSALNSSSREVVGDISSIIINSGSSDSARSMILNASSLGNISKNFLSPVSPEVFPEFRKYCIKYIGEGTKIVEESKRGDEEAIRSALMALSIVRSEFNMVNNRGKRSKIELIELNPNQPSNVNQVLEKCLDNPDIVKRVIKIFNVISKFYPKSSETFFELNNIFVDNSNFTYTLIDEKDEDGKVTSIRYFGGSKERESTIYRTIVVPAPAAPEPKKHVTKAVIVKVPQVKTKAKRNGFFKGSHSDSSSSDSSSSSSDSSDSSDSDSDAKEDDGFAPPASVFNINPTPVVNAQLEEESTSSVTAKQIKININLIKDMMRFLSENIPCSSSQVETAKARKTFDSILKGTFGETESEFVLDWWQAKYLENIREGKSFILGGDTSGGKTKVSILGTRIQMNKYLEDPTAIIVNLAPTPQLAVQQFANLLKNYPERSEIFGLSIKGINDVPPTCRVLIGTPCEVERFFYPVILQEGAKLSRENIGSTTTKSIEHPFVRRCRVLVIDEIQSLSPTYVQEQEVEHKMDCKAIENILRTISYAEHPNSQVVGLSATLSRGSIDNIKAKIVQLTGIPFLDEVIYSFDDIGLSNESKRSEHVPIMRRQVKYPIRLDGYNVTKFNPGETIVGQRLDNQVVESISRDAMSKGAIPIAFYRENELAAIEMYKSFIRYLDLKNSECRKWHSLKKDYDRESDIHKSKMLEHQKVEDWLSRITVSINETIHDVNSTTVVYGNFQELISFYDNKSGQRLSSMSPILSSELYGLLYEYNSIALLKGGFSSDIHPYYKFGNNYTSEEFFALRSNDTKTETTLNKILIAQDADPTDNTGGIIPLLLKGIKYGIGLVTSSIPLGFQLEIFRYINVKSKIVGSSNPLQILFCEYGMTAGVNFNTMSGCIVRPTLQSISPSEFKQTNGRSGRRGVASTIEPITYTFNISNVYEVDDLEVLSFDLSGIRSTFFASNEIYEYLTNMVVKVLRNQDTILGKDNNGVDSIIFGDAFKNLGGTEVLAVRKIQLAKYQTKEMYDLCKNMFPSISDNEIRKLYNFLQKCEFYNLNVHIL